jgi:hypothetical protein
MSNLIWLLIGIIILLLIIGLIQLRTPSRIMNTRFAKLIFKNTTLGDRLCELFYGVTMVSVMIGIINITASGYTNIKHVLLVVAFGVNITWGIIDGTTSVYGGLVDQAEEDRLVNSLRRNKQNQQYIDHLKDDLQATILKISKNMALQ